jgi:methylated-DNA-[protein]-cysteine S-methyltransferase
MPQAIYHSPFGPIRISASDKGITEISFVKGISIDNDTDLIQNQIIKDCTFQLDEYFSHKRIKFSIPLDPGGTGFQKQVWAALQNIPFGKVVSYLDIAKALEDPNKIRAVGNANGKNPIAIIVPCHRVIGSDGKLVGYVGGLDKKRLLLQFEGAIGRDLFD